MDLYRWTYNDEQGDWRQSFDKTLEELDARLQQDPLHAALHGVNGYIEVYESKCTPYSILDEDYQGPIVYRYECTKNSLGLFDIKGEHING